MKVDKKKAVMLFALTLLITSLLLINMNGPTSAQQSADPLYLHGPSLGPIHMNSNKTLTPVHMHSTEEFPLDLYYPEGTNWHELYPTYCIDWTLSVWWDNSGDGMFGPNDQIEMSDPAGFPKWYHVDRMTVTILLSQLQGPPPYDPWPGPEVPTMAIELKLPLYEPDVVYQPLGTLWHEVWPSYCNVYALTSWFENLPNGVLDPCDVVDLTNMSDPSLSYWHVEDVATDIILREKITEPICTWWHEIHPEFCTWWHLTSWEDNQLEGEIGYNLLSPGDQIDMVEKDSQNKSWYHVDRVTVTLNVTLNSEPSTWMKIELKTFEFEEMFEAFKLPEGTAWHEVIPEYCNVYLLVQWDFWEDDNCNGVLDVCDDIWLLNVTGGEPQGEPEDWHVVDITYDLILNEKISDPMSTYWQEIYPDYDIWYVIDGWTDNGDEILSPCDYINITDVIGGPTEEYHVENVTLTINITNPQQEPYLFEYIGDGTIEDMYQTKTNLNHTWWEMVWPSFLGETLPIEDWVDNCNGVLDYCDMILLGGVWCHVEGVFFDMVVAKEEPPPPFYWKKDYPEYAPSGVPDFDQKQDAWGNNQYMPPWNWTWCGPTAVANSLWWMDSRYHPSNLLTAYVGALSEHDPTNVPPFIQHLAYLMDTEGQRTLIAHRGTNVLDMEAGIIQYLQWTGVNPPGDVNGDGIVDAIDLGIVNGAMGTAPGAPGWDMRADIHPVTTGWPTPTMGGPGINVINANDSAIVNNHLGWTNGTFYVHTIPAPTFQQIEMEVEKCQDVVLLIAPWWQAETRYSEAAHFVTVAGVNSTTRKIALSDPMFDAFETGLTPEGRQRPVGVVHNHPANPPDTTHNNASLVSHDIYTVTNATPCQGGPESIVNYPGFDPGYVWQIEYAVITSPIVEEVCGVEITNVVPSKSEAYPKCTINVSVTVHNNGTILPINCTVNAYYYNATITQQIGTSQNITNLAPCNSINVTFTWNLWNDWISWKIDDNATYTIKANVTCTCSASDEFVNGDVKIRLLCDVDGSGAFTSTDVTINNGLLTKIMLQIITMEEALAQRPFADVTCDIPPNITSTDVTYQNSILTKIMLEIPLR